MSLLTLAFALAVTTSFAMKPAGSEAQVADGQISQMVMAANDAEIKAGQAAETQAVDPKVKAFAKHMVEEHTANNKATTTLDTELNVAPITNDQVTKMKVESAQKLTEVTSKTGKDFDKAYMTLQVSMHEQVLSTIEGQLLPMAKNAQMKAFLNTTKAHVAQHLAEAKKINSALK